MDLQAIAIVFEFMHPGSTAGRALGDDRPAGMDETRLPERHGAYV